LLSLGFGINYGNETASYSSILNSDESIYGLMANTSMLTLNYPGLGLPSTQFNKFASLLSRFTNENGCYAGPGGYCLLT